MASGRFLLAAALSLSTCAALPAISFAEDAAQSDSGNHVFLGEVNANAVFIHSRASEDAYPTMKVSKGTKVTVVGIKGPWLKIEPPEGSFAYVPKSFIILRNDGTVGRASRETIARAGSDLNTLAAQAMAMVHEGDDVQILGQHNEYFKIKPPKDSYVWINKQFVDPVKTVDPTTPADPTPTTPQPIIPTPSDHDTSAGAPLDHMKVGPIIENKIPSTQPATSVADAGAAPTTQPVVEVNSMAEYEKLEEQFTATSGKPIAEQPLPDLLAGYQKLVTYEDLPSSMRSIADMRIATLKLRNDAREKLLALVDSQKQMTEKRQAMVAERQEIEDRIKQNDIQIFAAVGTLRPSSLQVGQGLLYRLTDPASGRTVAYLRTNDNKYGAFLGQFIGVRGTITPDPQLKSVIENPIEAMAVDQSKVNVSIAAQIVPPSLNHFVPQPIAPVSPSTQPAAAPGASDQASTSGEPQ
jgi:hypothetical protein